MYFNATKIRIVIYFKSNNLNSIIGKFATQETLGWYHYDIFVCLNLRFYAIQQSMFMTNTLQCQGSI